MHQGADDPASCLQEAAGAVAVDEAGDLLDDLVRRALPVEVLQLFGRALHHAEDRVADSGQAVLAEALLDLCQRSGSRVGCIGQRSRCHAVEAGGDVAQAGLDLLALELQRVAHLGVGVTDDVGVRSHLLQVAVEDLALLGENRHGRLACLDRAEHVDHRHAGGVCRCLHHPQHFVQGRARVHHLVEGHARVLAALGSLFEVLGGDRAVLAQLSDQAVQLGGGLCCRSTLCRHSGQGGADLFKRYTEGSSGRRDLCQARAQLAHGGDAEVLGLDQDLLDLVQGLLAAHAVGVHRLGSSREGRVHVSEASSGQLRGLLQCEAEILSRYGSGQRGVGCLGQAVSGQSGRRGQIQDRVRELPELLIRSGEERGDLRHGCLEGHARVQGLLAQVDDGVHGLRHKIASEHAQRVLGDAAERAGAFLQPARVQRSIKF